MAYMREICSDKELQFSTKVEVANLVFKVNALVFFVSIYLTCIHLFHYSVATEEQFDVRTQ